MSPQRHRRRTIAAAVTSTAVLVELASGGLLLGIVGGRQHGHPPAAAGGRLPLPPGSATGSIPAGRQQSPEPAPGSSGPGAISSLAGLPSPGAPSPEAPSSGAPSTGPDAIPAPDGVTPTERASKPIRQAPANTIPLTAGEASGAAGTQPVTCQTDLPLSQAPDTGYAFLCEQGTTPLTWDRGHLVFYDQGLTVAQAAAFASAVVQWQAAAKFQVSYTADSRAADVVVSSVPLDTGQPGYTEDGYTTVSYRCSPLCAYYHADVELSSTATMTQTDWVSTVLHELGHVAGLNHVSMTGEVMYPYLTVTSPVVYAGGDRAGLAVLAAERGA